MDESFAALSRLLNFRDKEQERVQKREARMKGELSQEEKEMDEWDKEMKVSERSFRFSPFLARDRFGVSFFDPLCPRSNSGAPLSSIIFPFPNDDCLRRTYSNAR
jgi:hypothetical protein